ncbi:MAG: hypothetical protein JW942_07755, partial [Opitutales bacterium]|nr:hypothetical protein [Opitutales bacterium]
MPDAQARLREVATALIVATLFAILHTAAFPFAFVGGRVLGMSEAAYLFLAPLAWWLMRKRSIRATLLLSLGASWLSWTVLLIWLRHVTLFGTIGLALVMSLFTALWALGARLVLPNLQKRPALQRIGLLAALAGMWVICEWLRGVAF